MEPLSSSPESLPETVLQLWPQMGGTWEVTVRGNSMIPVLCDGDRVRIRLGADGLQCGQIIAFRFQGQLVTHRLIARPDPGTLLFKGDHCRTMDPLQPLEAVLGCVIARRRGTLWQCMDTLAWRWSGRLLAQSALLLIRIKQMKRKMLG